MTSIKHTLECVNNLLINTTSFGHITQYKCQILLLCDKMLGIVVDTEGKTTHQAQVIIRLVPVQLSRVDN